MAKTKQTCRFSVRICPRPVRYPDEWFDFVANAESEARFYIELLRRLPGAKIDKSTLEESGKDRNVSNPDKEPLGV